MLIEPPHFICVESIEKSPQVVKHVIKGEKWTCITPKAGASALGLRFQGVLRLKKDENYGIIRYQKLGGNHAYLCIHIQRKIWLS